MSLLRKIVPSLEWLAGYRRSDLRPDVIAGVTVAILLVPQAVAYAMLAGLPPVAGLYASVFPLLAYAVFGSSRHLAVGPTAVVSLLVFSGCSSLAEPGSAEYWQLATLLALLAGALQFLLSLLRMAHMVNFVSHAVVSGFTSGAAVLICLNQLGHVLGISVDGGETALTEAVGLAMHLGQTHPLALALGGMGIAVLVVCRKRAPCVPGPLVVVAMGTLLVYLLGWDEAGVSTVGRVPQGVPSFSLPRGGLASLRTLAPTAVVIAAISYMESMALIQLIAAKEKYRVDPTVELRAIGVANMVSGLCSGYPVTGSFSRTAVNYNAGARTGAAALVTAAIVLPALLFITPVFEYVPTAVLGAIIIAAASKLIDIETTRRFFRVDRADGWMLALTFVATLALGIEKGILAGVAFSLALFIWRSSHPHTAELGYVPGDSLFHDIERFPEAGTDPRALIVRVDRSLYFANMRFIEDRLRESIADRREVEWVVMDLSGVNEVDGVAVHTLDELIEEFGARGIRFLFAGMKGPVRDRFAKARWAETHEGPLTYPSVEHAVAQIDWDAGCAREEAEEE